MASTANTLDVFGDGSCIELITLDSHLNTVAHGACTVVAGSATFAAGEFDSALVGDGATAVEFPAIYSVLGGRPDIAISLWVSSSDGGADGGAPFLYSDSDLAGISMYSSSGSMDIDVGAMTDAGQYSVAITQQVDTFENVVININSSSDTFAIWHKGIKLYENTSFVDNLDGSQLPPGRRLSGFEPGDISVVSIDQVRFFNRALTDIEILALQTEKVDSEYFSQLSYLEPYHKETLVQSGEAGEYTNDTLSQNSDSSEGHTLSTLDQLSTIAGAFTLDLFSQTSENIDSTSEDRWFNQRSALLPYQPYIDKATVCDIFSGSPAALCFGSFESDISRGCGNGDFVLTGSANFAPGKDGMGFYFDGATTLQDNVAIGDAFTLSVWLDTHGDGVCLSVGSVLSIEMSNQVLTVKAGGVEFVSKRNEYFGLGTTVVIVKRADGNIRISVNNVLRFTSNGIIDAGNYPVILGGNCVLDAYRLFDGDISIKQELFLFYDVVAGEFFKQTSMAGIYTKSTLSQGAEIKPFTKDVFEQSSFSMGKNIHIFYQKSEIQDWSRYEVFSQVSWVESDSSSKILGRTN